MTFQNSFVSVDALLNVTKGLLALDRVVEKFDEEIFFLILSWIR